MTDSELTEVINCPTAKVKSQVDQILVALIKLNLRGFVSMSDIFNCLGSDDLLLVGLLLS